MSSIFISYRREDAAAHAGRVHDRLAAAFGDERVFIDVDAIQPGQDFDAVIRRTLDDARVVVVVIGPRWLASADAGGLRRLDAPRDYVRLEIAAALERGITVIPVLVGGAKMPAPDDLPVELRPLALRNAIELSDSRFHRDADGLIEAAHRYAGSDGGALLASLTGRARHPRRLWLTLGAPLLLLAGSGIVGWNWLGGAEVAPPRRSGGAPTRAPSEAASTATSHSPLWRWRVRHILVALPPHPNDAEKSKARERAQRLADSARREPADFAALAQRFSDDASSAERGGDLGYFRVGTMHPAFEDAVLRMHKGEIAGPIESPDGFHVIQLTSVQRSTRVVMNGQEVFVEVD